MKILLLNIFSIKDLKESNEKHQININKLNDKILQLQNHINEPEKKIE